MRRFVVTFWESFMPAHPKSTAAPSTSATDPLVPAKRKKAAQTAKRAGEPAQTGASARPLKSVTTAKAAAKATPASRSKNPAKEADVQTQREEVLQASVKAPAKASAKAKAKEKTKAPEAAPSAGVATTSARKASSTVSYTHLTLPT
ncbi:MAG: hypothetical protein EBX71_08990, partial [Betaproteobacteria bacterium]|nr:hypothetical protein [Betaproteobacteria bacterium]